MKIRGKYLIRHFTWSWLRKWVEVRIPIKVKDEKASKKGNFLKNLAWISVWIKNLIMLGRVWRAYVTTLRPSFFIFLPGRSRAVQETLGRPMPGPSRLGARLGAPGVAYCGQRRLLPQQWFTVHLLWFSWIIQLNLSLAESAVKFCSGHLVN